MKHVKSAQLPFQQSPLQREIEETRPDTRLPQSRAGGQEPQLRSPDHLGRSSEAKNPKNPKKVKCDGPTDGPMDGRTDGGTDRRTD